MKKDEIAVEQSNYIRGNWIIFKDDFILTKTGKLVPWTYNNAYLKDCQFKSYREAVSTLKNTYNRVKKLKKSRISAIGSLSLNKLFEHGSLKI